MIVIEHEGSRTYRSAELEAFAYRDRCLGLARNHCEGGTGSEKLLLHHLRIIRRCDCPLREVTLFAASPGASSLRYAPCERFQWGPRGGGVTRSDLSPLTFPIAEVFTAWLLVYRTWLQRRCGWFLFAASVCCCFRFFLLP